MKMDMTKGSPLKLIIMFALPLFFSNLFQQFYNLADTAIVGHTLGDHALSSVGAVSTLYNLMNSLCFGMTTGFSIVISKYFGAEDEANMKRSIAGTIMLSTAFTLIMTLCFFLLVRPLMRILNTPDEIFDDAYTYISIIIVCAIVMVFYNMLSCILRALGNSTTPLLFLVISSLLNIGLDLLFILKFGLGIAGAAYATVLAQLISGLACLIYIYRVCPSLLPDRSDFHISKELVNELLSAGAAMSLMWAVVNIGSVILQSGINSLGTDIIAAHVSARKMSEIYMMFGATLSSTMSTFTSQNYGAGKLDRVWTGVKDAHILGWIWSTLIIIVTYALGDQIIRALTGSDNATIIATGTKYLRIDLPFYYVLFVLCILRNTLQGLNCKIWPVIGSIMELSAKLITVAFFIGPFGYNAVCFCEPVSWIVCAALISLVFFTNKDMKPILYPKKYK